MKLIRPCLDKFFSTAPYALSIVVFSSIVICPCLWTLEVVAVQLVKDPTRPEAVNARPAPPNLEDTKYN